MKNKLILFDWGNIVESFTTGYTLGDAFKDLFKDLGYKKDDILIRIRKYMLTSISTMEQLENCYNEIKKELNLDKDFNFINSCFL